MEQKSPEQKIIDWLKTQDFDVREFLACCINSSSHQYPSGSQHQQLLARVAEAIVELPPSDDKSITKYATRIDECISNCEIAACRLGDDGRKDCQFCDPFVGHVCEICYAADALLSAKRLLSEIRDQHLTSVLPFSCLSARSKQRIKGETCLNTEIASIK